MKKNIFITMIIILYPFLMEAQGFKGDKDKSGKTNTGAFSSENNWGIGLRFGDPSGISVKKYFGNTALELNVGLSHTIAKNGYWDGHYRNEWEDRYCLSSYDDCDYLGFSRSRPLGLQLHYLWHWNIPGAEGLSWYAGAGGQMAFQTVRYSYRYKPFNGSPWIYDDGGSYTDFDFGADGVAGLEYTFKKVPISLFLDVNLFLEIYDSPFVFWFQSGIGGRYNF